jgi:hypothetical protein
MAQASIREAIRPSPAPKYVPDRVTAAARLDDVVTRVTLDPGERLRVAVFPNHRPETRRKSKEVDEAPVVIPGGATVPFIGEVVRKIASNQQGQPPFYEVRPVDAEIPVLKPERGIRGLSGKIGVISPGCAQCEVREVETLILSGATTAVRYNGKDLVPRIR